MPAAERHGEEHPVYLDADLSYIRVEHIDGERICFLYAATGEPLIGSRYGMVALINYAANRGMTICSLH